MKLTPINQRRLQNFKANRRGYWSAWLFGLLFLISLPAEFIANDKPLLVSYDGGWYSPILVDYPETTFGGEFETTADYTDPYVVELIEEKGWLVWPLIYHYRTNIKDLPGSAPTAPLQTTG